jgi:murein DD-endopeptidase MepM/ murein hydrolase activator NlpD
MAEIIWPFDISTITEWCGTDRGNGVIHMGTDFGVPQGTLLHATVSGVVSRWETDGLGAYVLDIMRADGLLVRNAHLSRMDVQTGDRVSIGQVIGLTGGAVGTKGSGESTGPHLHWELRWDRLWRGGHWVDPRPFFASFAGLDAAPFIETKLEEDEMKTAQITWIRSKDGARLRALFTPGTAYWLAWEGDTNAAIANGFAQALTTGNGVEVSESMANAIERAANQLLGK